ncbi:MAG: RNA polymerase sigma factor, partial [Gammaproteobacteria bacterium]|nr:RNA polymerase sigma factor [Gammaproteobacteria bacterium]
MDEHELIAKLIAGDEAAFRETVRVFDGPMTYVARAIVGPGSAADVVQDAWVSVIKSLPQFERRASLKTWVLSIVSNAAKSHLRKQGRMIAMGDAQDLENVGLNQDRFRDDGHWANPPRAWDMNTPEHLLGSEQLREQIFKTIGDLPENQRAV